MPVEQKVKIGILGASGYTGAELLRLLITHPRVEVMLLTAERRAEVLATYFICCFTGNAVPVIGVGLITVLLDALTATASFAVLVALFAIAAFVSAQRYRN